jgi:predicted phosphodiesterase
MKIQLLSDLHLEAHPNWLAEPAPGADMLVLAGDIGSYQKGSGLRDTDFGLGQFSPKNGWPTPVVFVPGNHEYDALDFDAAHLRLQETCERLGIQWLERHTLLSSQVDLHGNRIRLIGTTLWTDFDALVPTDTGVNALTLQLKAREKAFRAANYYLRKTATTRNETLFLAEQMRELALHCQAWLREALLTPFDGTTVVVTHFAPTLQSADPRYGLTPGTAGFCNALDDLLPHAALWLHGHLHAPSDYVQRGCRVVANPLGYARKNEQSLFRPTGLIEI